MSIFKLSQLPGAEVLTNTFNPAMPQSISMYSPLLYAVGGTEPMLRTSTSSFTMMFPAMDSKYAISVTAVSQTHPSSTL